MTKYERAIYNMINSFGDHLTAGRIYENLKADYPGVALATVYNNLNNLCRENLIRKVSIEGMPDRYDTVCRHDHLVCRYCGKLVDIRFEDLTESLRGQLQDDFLFYDLKVYTICPDCRVSHGDHMHAEEKR